MNRAYRRYHTDRGVPQMESPLILRRFSDTVYFLDSEIAWKPNQPQVGRIEPVEVPAGFVTDLTSVPQVFFMLFRPDGNYVYAAIIHDYLYWMQNRSRREADEIFKIGMQDLKVSSASVSTLFAAVSVFGYKAWEQNAKLKQAGERRFLRTYPTHPLTTWSEWKKNPDVFDESLENLVLPPIKK